MSDPKAILSAQNLTIGYRSGKKNRVVAENLNLDLCTGQLVCLLGPNGAGKSTLMRTLSGLQPAISGNILIDGNPLANLPVEKLAQKLSLVLTEKLDAGNLTVIEVIALGRTPYTGWLGKLSIEDHEKIRWAIQATDLIEVSYKRVHHLSDGERQKVMLARALAQDTQLILLDEPTAHLDLPSRVEMMHLLHNLARKTQKAILLSTHELDLALQAADQLWLMKRNGEMTRGVPEDLVLNGAFESTFEKSGFYFDKSSGGFQIHREEVLFNVSLSGDSDLIFWTKRALLREGIGIQPDKNSNCQITAFEENNRPGWTFDFKDSLTTYFSLAELVRAITRTSI